MASGEVSCGPRLAPSCEACGTSAPASCLGDCVRVNVTRAGGVSDVETCTALWTQSTGEPPFVGAASRRFDPAVHTLRLLEASPSGAAALNLLLVGSTSALGGRWHARCRRTDGSNKACAPDAPLSDWPAWWLRLKCTCAAAGGSGHEWLDSRITAPSAPPAAAHEPRANASGRAFRVALLRHPLAARQEVIEHPELCSHLPQPSRLRGVCAAPPRDARRGKLDEWVRLCCRNRMARALVSGLDFSPRAAAGVARCAEGECDAATLSALARRALLELDWFGTHEALAPSLSLLAATTGLGVSQAASDGAVGGIAEWIESLRPSAPPIVMALPRWARSQRAIGRENAADVRTYRLAVGILGLRLRRAGIDGAAVEPDVNGTRPDGVPRVGDGRIIFGGGLGRRASGFGGETPALVRPPVRFRRQVDSIVFVHIAKCGGTSFNQRLTTLQVGTRCVRRVADARGEEYRLLNGGQPSPIPMHNGHPLVEPRTWYCPRREGPIPPLRFSPARSRWDSRMQLSAPVLRAARGLQSQWLLSPETIGWCGGVHAPVRETEATLLWAASLSGTARGHAADGYRGGLHFVTMLREPVERFLSEFYETYNGWEVRFATPPRVLPRESCSARLPPRSELRNISLRGIDFVSKQRYDQLFEHWIRCPKNMAANRQARVMSYSSEQGFRARARAALCGWQVDERRGVAHRPAGGAALGREACDFEVARHSLLQFSFFGLLHRRCASERLFEAQFGVRFDRSAAARVHAGSGRGAHKVAKLRMSELGAASQRRVLALNSLDIKLFQEAERIFERRLRAYGIPLNATC